MGPLAPIIAIVALVVLGLFISGVVLGLQDGGGTPAGSSGGPRGTPTHQTAEDGDAPAGDGPGAATESAGATPLPAPPGGWLVFKRYQGDRAVNDSPIVVVDPTGREHQLGPGDAPDVAPDGSRVAYATVGGQIVTVRPDGADQRQLPNLGAGSAEYPAWSPDGTQIAYFENTGGIYLLNADGTNGRRLASVHGLEPSWSPDGSEIVFRDPGTQTLKVVSTRDGTVRSLTGSPRAGTAPVEPSWSPDGATIVFGTADGGIYAMAPDGTGLRALAGADAWHPTWSPDGRIAFVFDPTATTFFATSGPVETMAKDGSDIRPVDRITASGPVHWARGR
jgi:hypothetical protein